MAKAGKPEHIPTEITRAEVSALVAYGIKQDHIAARLRISVDTLAKHYAHELETGLSTMIGEVANALYRKGVEEGDTTALIFILKTRGRWRDKDPDDGKAALSVIEKFLEKLPQQQK